MGVAFRRSRRVIILAADSLLLGASAQVQPPKWHAGPVRFVVPSLP